MSLTQARHPLDLDDVYVVIPCFNDGDALVETLHDISRYVPLDRIVVVDDGSDPPLPTRPPTLHIRNAINQGLASSVAAGLRAALTAGAACVVKVDADGQMDASYLPRFVGVIRDGFDVATGSFDPSASPASVVRDDTLFSRLATWLLSVPFPTLLAEYRAYSHRAATIVAAAPLYGWESCYSLLYCAHLSVVHIPNSVRAHHPRPFPLSGMIALRVGLLRHARSQGAPLHKLLAAALILTCHLFYNFLFNFQHNGKRR